MQIIRKIRCQISWKTNVFKVYGGTHFREYCENNFCSVLATCCISDLNFCFYPQRTFDWSVRIFSYNIHAIQLCWGVKVVINLDWYKDPWTIIVGLTRGPLHALVSLKAIFTTTVRATWKKAWIWNGQKSVAVKSTSTVFAVLGNSLICLFWILLNHI